MPKLSIIVPIYNEAESLPFFFEKLNEALQDHDFEIIAVNDGSKDNSLKVLAEAAITDKNLKVIDFKRNFGQTAAINAGIQYASGDILVLIDSDLENNPNDIPKLLNKLDEGFDVVSGWRKNRWKDNILSRKLPSVLANKLISKISGVSLHDYGCTLKAYKREVIKDINLYGQMHRFIPVYCKWQGGKVTEMEVDYSPRMFGQSNYGIMRTFKVVLDLILIKFLDKYMQRPIHFFGGVGFMSLFLAFICGFIAIGFKVTGQKDFVETPLPVLVAIFLILGIIMIFLGVIAEMQMRTYYESQNKYPFSVKSFINFDNKLS